MTTLTGRVIYEGNRENVPWSRISARNEDQVLFDIIAQAFDSTFVIEVDDSIRAALAGNTDNITLEVYGEGGATLPVATWQVGPCQPGQTELQVTIVVEQFVSVDPLATVTGRVLAHDGTLVTGMLVKAYDRDLGDNQSLGEAISGDGGLYQIVYNRELLEIVSKERADLFVRVFSHNRDDVILGESDTVKQVLDEVQLDIVITLPAEPNLSEYEIFWLRLGRFLGDRLLSELGADEVTEMSERSGLERTQLTMLVQATGLSRQTELPVAAFYGLLRRDLPAELDALLAQPADAWREALISAAQDNIIPAQLHAAIEYILEYLNTLRDRHTPMVELSSSLGSDHSSPLFPYLAEEPVPPVLELPSPALSELVSVVPNLNLELLSALAARGVHNLADIRAAGGTGQLHGLPVLPDDPTIRILEAHSDLIRLSPNVELNAKLLEKGFTSVSTIANTPRTDFIERIREEVGDFKAAKLHVEALAQTSFLNNTLAGTLTNMLYADEIAEGTVQHNLRELTGTQCTCRDCEAAVSPLAYLSDLLDYVNKNLHGGDAVTFATVPAVSSWVIESPLPTLPDSRRLDIFIRSADKALWHKKYEGEWSNWHSLGGSLASDPVVVSWGANRIDIFARGIDSALWHLTYDNGWSSWHSLGGVLTSEPAAISWGPNRLDVFARGADDALWHIWFDGTWQSWESLEGELSSPPSVCSWGSGRLDVFVRGSDGALWHKWYQNAWSTWDTRGGYLYSDPVAVSWGIDRIDVFARVGNPPPKWHLIHTWFDGTWNNWELLGLFASPEIAVASRGPRYLDVFGVLGSGKLQHKWFDGTWHDAIHQPWGGSFVSNPAVLLTSSGGSQWLDLFALNSSSEITHKQFVGGVWSEELIPLPSFSDFLIKTLHQPFSSLPASCESVDRQIRQVRICIEVLRSYLKSRLASVGAGLPTFGQPEPLGKAYRLAAYTTLLKRIGTSYEEIRLARSAEEEVRQSLASRLGVDLKPVVLPTDRPGITFSTNTLDVLFLDPNAGPPVPNALTEERLEALFGLRNTKRDPLSDAPTAYLQTWRLKHLRTLWKEQDWSSDPYTDGLLPLESRLTIIDPDIIGPDDLRNPKVGQLALDLWKYRREWVDARLKDLAKIRKVVRGGQAPDLAGIFKYMYQPVSYATAVVYAWKNTQPSAFDQLRDNLIQGTDLQVRSQVVETISTDLNLSVESFTRLLAIRDIDDAASDDPRNPQVTQDEWQEVYSILVQAQKAAMFPTWITEEEQKGLLFSPKEFWVSLRQPREGEWVPPLYAAQRFVEQPLIDPEFVNLERLAALMPSKASLVIWQKRSAQINQAFNELKIKREAQGFDAMLKLALGHPKPGHALPHNLVTLEKDLNGSNPTVVNGAIAKITKDLYMPIEDFRRLMVIKAKDDQTDPAKKPIEAEWLEVYAILSSARKVKRNYQNWTREEGKLPLIDPDILKLEALPEPTFGKDAIKLWDRRKIRLQTIYSDLKSKRKAPGGGFDAMLKLALGHPRPGDALPHDLEVLNNSLKNQINVEDTIQKITQDFYMPVEDFNRLLVIKAKDAQSDLAKKPTVLEWAEVYSILAHAQKLKREYPSWTNDEHRAHLTYWSAYKAKLPRWRAGVESRQQWLQAFRMCSAAPLINPDLIGPGDLKFPFAGNTAFDLWTERDRWVNDPDPAKGQMAKLRAVREAEATTLDGLKKILESAIGEIDLKALSDDQKKGENIQARLDQFSLTYAAFSYLLRIHELAAKSQLILDSEWNEVYAILIRVLKRREFAEWRAKEREKGLSLSPDYFRILEVDQTIFPPLLAWQPRAWLATWEARYDWQDMLQSRLDQEKVVIEALQEAVSSTEEATLPMLRDELIMATDVTGSDLDSKARWITDNLLIDAKVNGCQMTTRVAQAIETIQGLLWSLRTDQLTAYPGLALNDPDFDEKWEWIGSYATWRAAMFVFIYPENILLPSLRRHQTPAFRKLVSDLRDNKRLTPGQACLAAKEYSEYFRDVCSLQLEACVQANSRTYEIECPNSGSQGYKSLSFFFGRSTVSNKVYWSTRDTQAEPTYAQTFWREILALKNVINLIGAIEYQLTEKERFIYLFARTQQSRQQKLVFIRYDLENSNWVQEPTELELPNKATEFKEAKLQQKAIPTNPPRLGIKLVDDTFHTRSLNEKGNGWESQDFQSDKRLVKFADFQDIEVDQMPVDPWLGKPITKDSDPFGAKDVAARFASSHLYANNTNIHVSGLPDFHETRSGAQYGTFLLTPEGAKTLLLTSLDLGNHPAKTDGNFDQYDTVNRFFSILTYVQDPSRNQIYAGGFPNFAEFPGTYGVTLLTTRAAFRWKIRADDLKQYNGNQRPRSKFDPDFKAIDVANRFTVVHDYVVNNQNLFQKTIDGFPAFDDQLVQPSNVKGDYWTTIIIIRGPTEEMVPTGPWIELPCNNSNIAPIYKGPYDITEKQSGNQLQNRKQQIAKVMYQDNKGQPRSNLTYFEEAWYFVPIAIALQLQQRGQYIAALDWFRTVYDYSAPAGKEKIYFGLEVEALWSDVYERAQNWLLDPLNPHLIAESRRNAYTRFTLLSLIRCFLEYADAEFTRDTPESVERARTLYLTALELLNTGWLQQSPLVCDDLIGTLDGQVSFLLKADAPEWTSVWSEIKRELLAISDSQTLRRLVNDLRPVLAGGPWSERLARAREIIGDAKAKLTPPLTLADLIHERERFLAKAHNVLAADPLVSKASTRVGAAAGNDLLQAVSAASGIGATTLKTEKVELPWLRSSSIPPVSEGTVIALVPEPVARTITARGGDGHAATGAVAVQPLLAMKNSQNLSIGFIPILAQPFCIPSNPVLKGLRLRAELNLYKLRNCRNIAGMKRQLEPYAASTDTESGLPTIGAGGNLILPGAAVLQPTPYRYPVLIERTKQLVQIAGQIETAMLSALEKRDVEAYNLLKARQDVHLARAGVRLQNLRVKEAESGVKLAELQKHRSEIQSETYQEWIDTGLIQLEKDLMDWFGWQAGYQIASAIAAGSLSAASLAWQFAPAPWYMHVWLQASNAQKTTADVLAIIAQANINVLGVQIGLERRKQEWELQKKLADQDILINDQQIRIAEDHVRVVGQERAIAEMESEHAEAIVEFLSSKFTNVELYDWMSGILERVYSFFLQQATAIAKLAENQLAFERHETPPAFIQADYWETPTDEMGGSTNGRAPDRWGLTGSARLLQDIYQLDQYAFETNKRKLQLTKTISLSQLSPVEFQSFQETGVIVFRTPMEMFDRDFPGHYLRLVKRVRTSVVALVPPIQGIHATLSTTGVSRVVIGGDVFETVVVRRDPESVALSSPLNATGVFELEAQSEMLFPFEGLGVDTIWELRMPKAANLFDYRSIADVLITIEYTALNSFDYQQQVIQSLSSKLSAERAFSFRNQFADQWYDLHNPDQTQTPMIVQFNTAREDFPPNLGNLKIQQVVLYFARKTGSSFEIPVTHFRFAEQGSTGSIGGAASSIDGVISTRRGNAGSWMSMIGKSPFGKWELALPNTEEMKARFKNEEIEDILFVIAYGGRLPEWLV